MTEAPGLALVAEALRRGVRVVWEDPPRYRGPADALALVKEAPDTAREVLRRAAAFRRQLEEWGHPAGVPAVPLLVLSDTPSPAPGQCISCAADLPAAQTWRCALCLAAVQAALGLPPLA